MYGDPNALYCSDHKLKTKQKDQVNDPDSGRKIGLKRFTEVGRKQRRNTSSRKN